MKTQFKNFLNELEKEIEVLRANLEKANDTNQMQQQIDEALKLKAIIEEHDRLTKLFKKLYG